MTNVEPEFNTIKKRFIIENILGQHSYRLIENTSVEGSQLPPTIREFFFSNRESAFNLAGRLAQDGNIIIDLTLGNDPMIWHCSIGGKYPSNS